MIHYYAVNTMYLMFATPEWDRLHIIDYIMWNTVTVPNSTMDMEITHGILSCRAGATAIPGTITDHSLSHGWYNSMCVEHQRHVLIIFRIKDYKGIIWYSTTQFGLHILLPLLWSVMLYMCVHPSCVPTETDLISSVI